MSFQKYLKENEEQASRDELFREAIRLRSHVKNLEKAILDGLWDMGYAIIENHMKETMEILGEALKNNYEAEGQGGSYKDD